MSSSYEWRRVGTRGFAALGAVVSFLVAASGGRAASPKEEAGLQDPWLADWSPALNVEFGVHAQEMTASGSATFGANGRGTNTISTLLARVEAGIATPPLGAIPGTPRLVLRGGASFSTRETATVSSAQQINGAELGTEFNVAWKEMWHAGVDLRFLLPIPEQKIIIQPGFEYLQSRFRFEPLFTYRAQPGSPEAQGFPNPRNPPTLDFQGRSGSDVNRMIGPSLSIEGNVLNLGPLAINAYLQGRMYWLIGDRSTAVAFSAPLLNRQESAAARMKANVIAGQVGFGIRGSF